ncbi:MAG: hypothetical protein FWE70_08575, partial [Oscillospiraceae bacterium]|nr:hypothetical protein [Oscillospiraceae bacterium]
FEETSISSAGDILKTQEVRFAKGGRKLGAQTAEEFRFIMPKSKGAWSGEWELDKKVTLFDGLTAPIAKGEVVGRVDYYVGEYWAGQGDLVANADIECINLVRIMNGPSKVSVTQPDGVGGGAEEGSAFLYYSALALMALGSAGFLYLLFASLSNRRRVRRR